MNDLITPIRHADKVVLLNNGTARVESECIVGKNHFLTFDLQPGQTITIAVVSGKIWATMEGDTTDYVSEAGEQLSFSSTGRLVVEALDISSLAVVLHAETPFNPVPKAA